jgi:hypothetical protein
MARVRYGGYDDGSGGRPKRSPRAFYTLALTHGKQKRCLRRCCGVSDAADVSGVVLIADVLGVAAGLPVS